MYISFAYSEGICEIIVENMEDNTTMDFTIDSSAPATLPVGPLTSAQITIATALGHTYSGTL